LPLAQGRVNPPPPSRPSRPSSCKNVHVVNQSSLKT